jgi:hypothetical protein
MTYNLESKLNSRPISELTAEFLDSKGIENLVLFVHPFFRFFVHNVSNKSIDKRIKEGLDGIRKKETDKRKIEFMEKLFAKKECDEFDMRRRMMYILIGDSDAINVKQAIETEYLFNNLNQKTALIYTIPRDAEKRFSRDYPGAINSIVKNKENTFHLIGSVDRDGQMHIVKCEKDAFSLVKQIMIYTLEGNDLRFHAAGANIKQCLVPSYNLFFLMSKNIIVNTLYHLTSMSSRSLKCKIIKKGFADSIMNNRTMDFSKDVDKFFETDYDQHFTEHVEMVKKGFMDFRRMAFKDKKYLDPSLLKLKTDYRHADEMKEITG